MFVADLNVQYLPVFQQPSARTKLAEERNDPYKGLEKSVFADCSIFSLIRLHISKQKLEGLRHLPKNWDGFGSAQPNPVAISNALRWLEDLYYQIIHENLEWRRPHINTNEDGDVVFEWWRGDHKLTIYLGADQAEYIKVWGSHIGNEMADGKLEASTVIDLWLWLNA